MIIHNNKYYVIKETHVDNNKCAIVLREYEDEALTIPSNGKIVILPYVIWDETTLQTLATNLESNPSDYTWYEFNPYIIDTLLAPEPSIDILKEAKRVAIAKSCQDAIWAGFNSSALGTTHLYPAGNIDQTNLTGVVMKSVLPTEAVDAIYPFKCRDANGEWAFRNHTRAQIHTVGSHSYDHVLMQRTKNALLQYQIDVAQTIEAVNNINW